MWLMRPCHKKAGKHRHFLKRCVYAGGEFLMHDRNRIRKSVFQRIYGRRQYQQRRETDGCSKANIGVPVCFGGFALKSSCPSWSCCKTEIGIESSFLYGCFWTIQLYQRHSIYF